MIDEDQINNMSYIFFEDVLAELGHKLNYDAVVNFAGNSFMEKSWEMIQDANPMLIDTEGEGKMKRSTMNTLASFIDKNVRTVGGGDKLPGRGFNGRDKRGV